MEKKNNILKDYGNEVRSEPFKINDISKSIKDHNI